MRQRTSTASRGPRHPRAVVAHRENDFALVARRAQDAFLPFLIVVLAWVVATSAVTGR